MAEISLTEQKECGHVPLVVHFSKVLPSEPIDGITTRDSGGTTGSTEMTEDANIDYDD